MEQTKKRFSLVTALIIVVIVGILAVAALLFLPKYLDSVNEKAAVEDAKTISKQINDAVNGVEAKKLADYVLFVVKDKKIHVFGYELDENKLYTCSFGNVDRAWDKKLNVQARDMAFQLEIKGALRSVQLPGFVPDPAVITGGDMVRIVKSLGYSTDQVYAMPGYQIQLDSFAGQAIGE